MVKLMVVGFLFYWKVDATLSDGFDKNCTVSGKQNVYWVIPRL